MVSGFVKAICQVGIFLICAQAIVHFRPKAAYEKYLKMLVSSMILIQLFASVADFLGAEGEEKLFERAEQFSERLEESMQEASEIAFFTGEESTIQIMGRDPDAEDAKTEKEIQNINVQISPVSPIQVDIISEEAGAERGNRRGSEGDVEEMVSQR